MAYSEADYAPLIFKIYIPAYNRYIKAGQTVPIVMQSYLITQDGLEIPWDWLTTTDRPKITILNPSNTIIINQATMVYTATGNSTYTFDTTGLSVGSYSAVFRAVHSNSLSGQTVKHQVVNRKAVVCTII